MEKFPAEKETNMQTLLARLLSINEEVKKLSVKNADICKQIAQKIKVQGELVTEIEALIQVETELVKKEAEVYQLKGKQVIQSGIISKHYYEPLLMGLSAINVKESGCAEPPSSRSNAYKSHIDSCSGKSVGNDLSDFSMSISDAIEASESRYEEDFTQVQRLGKGGYGKVTKSQHKLDGATYAVKKIRYKACDEEKILREVRALSRLNHQNIVRYYQAWKELYKESTNVEAISDDDMISSDDSSLTQFEGEFCMYIQMEYCRWTLAQLLDKSRESINPWQCFRQIVEAVCHIHENNIIHRDLSPQNIFLDEDMKVKIGDFGLAKIYDENDASNSSRDTKGIGNKLYRAPEMEDSDDKIGPKVDIFSLGIILFELLYKTVTQQQRIELLMALKIRRFPDDMNERDVLLISQLLSHEPHDRPSAAVLLNQVSLL